jgi:hypothetical protein
LGLIKARGVITAAIVGQNEEALLQKLGSGESHKKQELGKVRDSQEFIHHIGFL